MPKTVFDTRPNRGSGTKRLTALEFYSGIGGMHAALRRAGSKQVEEGEVLAAFDINPIANTVYKANFPSVQLRSEQWPKFAQEGAIVQNNIEKIPTAQLDEYAAQLWMLAPPCQPYTRQGLRKDAGDARAQSFLVLLDRIQEMRRPPEYIIIENVVGFECSAARAALVAALTNLQYHFQEFILSPRDFGIPYSRPRYFCVARKEPFLVTKQFQEPWQCTPEVLLQRWQQGETGFTASPIVNQVSPRPIGDFLDTSLDDDADPLLTTVNTASTGLSSGTVSPDYEVAQQHQQQTDFACVSSITNECTHRSHSIDERWARFAVPSEMLQKTADCIDIVTSDLHDCNCFTKSYGKYGKGTGSVIATQNLFVLNSFGDWGHREKAGPPSYAPPSSEALVTSLNNKSISQRLHMVGLRFFTPREVARLHSFPENFALPDELTTRQQYACLGNSLSVLVVSELLCYLLHQRTR